MKEQIAEWATRNRTRRIVLYRDAYGYSYTGDGVGGCFPASSDAHAIETMEAHAVAVQRVDFPSTVRVS